MKPGQGRWISSCTAIPISRIWNTAGTAWWSRILEAFPTRVEGRKPSYMLMELDRQGEAHFTICYLEDEDRNQELEQMGIWG